MILHVDAVALQSQLGEDGSEVLYVDNNRGHTRSFSSEKIFQDYRAQQVRSTPAAAAAAPALAPAPVAPAVPAAALGSIGSSSPGKAAAVAAGLVGSTAAAAVGGKSQMSSFDEEVQDDAPSLGGGVRLSDPLGVS